MEFGKFVFKFLTCTSKTGGRNILSRYSSDLNSYASACETDPNLKTFDSSLRQRTKKVMSSLKAGDETQFSSLDSHMEVYEFLFQLNQDTVRFITQNKFDVRNNKDLNSLVDAYFQSTVTILEFCNTVQNCVEKAEINKLMIQFAIQQFDTEENNNNDDDDDGDMNQKKKKYTKTLEALNKFTATEDPFQRDFYYQYELVCEEQLLLLEKLHNLKNKLDKKLKDLSAWNELSNVVFVTAFASVLVLSLVAAAHGSPQLMEKIGSLTGHFVRAGKWFDDMCDEYEKVMIRQKNVVESIELGVKQLNIPMENMRVEAERLKGKIEFLRNAVELAKESEDEAMVKIVMQKIKEKIDEFTAKIEQVGKAADTCGKFIASARLDVLEHIMGLPSGTSVAGH